MSGFIAFDSWEDAERWMARERLLALAAIQPRQWGLGKGSRFITIAPEMDNLIIYNEAMGEIEGPYLYVRAFSVIVPRGEYGDVALCNAQCLLTDRQWHAAEAAGWPDDANFLLDLLNMEGKG